MFSHISDLISDFKAVSKEKEEEKYSVPKINVFSDTSFKNCINTGVTNKTQVLHQTCTLADRVCTSNLENKDHSKLPTNMIPISSLIKNDFEQISEINISNAITKLGEKITPQKTEEENQTEETEKEREEYSFELMKTNYKNHKLQIIHQLQKDKGLQTKECRKAILLWLLDDYTQMEKKVCYTSNERLLVRLQEFVINVCERTLKRDLAELKEEGYIEVKIEKYQNQYLQIKTARQIKTTEATERLNTFCPVETLTMESLERNKFINVLEEISKSYIQAKTYLQEEYKRIKRYWTLKKRTNKKESIPINVHEVVGYFLHKLGKSGPAAIDFFNWYSKRGWKDSGGKSISSWQGIAKVWK